MGENFSDQKKFRTWRQLWIILAEVESALGLRISRDQIEELKRHRDDIDYEAAERYERELRHDLMAHLRAYGDQCPKAKPILHLGATSCCITDNADLMIMRDGLEIVERKLANVVDVLATFAEKYRNMPTVGLTHLQPAQLTTVGKRACLWAQDFAMDLSAVQSLVEEMPFRGVKGAIGTQSSFLQLFDGDHEKVKKLDQMVTEAAGFPEPIPVSGQTYTRKVDSWVVSVLAGVGQSAHKFADDIRLLQHRREVEEPFGEAQVGSSAMPYKRNPMRCERITGLARFLICMAPNAYFTAAAQWLERTLDDSSNRRLVLPEAFLAADAVLDIALDVASGLCVNEPTIARGVREELPFIASEVILMEAVKAGGDRQVLHARLREHSLAAARQREEGQNNLLERVASDPAFAAVRDRLDSLTRPEDFVGRAPEQVTEFLQKVISPIRKRYAGLLGMKAQVEV
jgi:adenylosuccinate lyase